MKIEFDNTVTRLTLEDGHERNVYDTLREGLKVMAPGARYMYEHKRWLLTRGKKGWDGKVSILNKSEAVGAFTTAMFPSGLLPIVLDNMTHSLMTPINMYDFRTKTNPARIFNSNITVPLRDYQQLALDVSFNNRLATKVQAFSWPCGVLKIATGGGKTELAIAMYQKSDLPSLFVVHRKHLIKQTRDRFKHYGIMTGQIGDGVYSPIKEGMTVATVQTLHNILKAQDHAKMMDFINVQQVFFDEAHLCAADTNKGNQFIALSRMLRTAQYRWGLTATPFMKDEYSNQLLMGATGPVLFEITNADLISKGFLTSPKVKIIKVPSVMGPLSWPEVYDSAIVLNRWRNEKIIEELQTIPTPAIIMTTRLGHAELLSNLAKSQGLFLPVVCGNTTTKERAQRIKDLASGSLKYIVATTVFDEGVDLPELRAIILAGAGKSVVGQLQRIGRGLRVASGKDSFLLVDFNDTTGTILKKHSKKRKDVWVKEGFNIEEIK